MIFRKSTPVTALLMSLASLLNLKEIVARSWAGLVDIDSFATSTFDPYLRAGTIESDPFRTGPNTANPTISPTIDTEKNTLSPSQTPFANCISGSSNYRVRMYDSWGDGWDGTVLKIVRDLDQGEVVHHPIITSNNTSTSVVSKTTTAFGQRSTQITVFQGSLSEGQEGFEYVCLQPGRCYEVTVGGGQWENEVKWSISQVGADRKNWRDEIEFAKGYAPTTCRFSIPNQQSDTKPVCPSVCEYGTSNPTLAPHSAPSGRPTGTPSTLPSSAPSAVPSTRPSTTIVASAVPIVVSVRPVTSVRPQSSVSVPPIASSPPNASGFPSDMPSLMPSYEPSKLPPSKSSTTNHTSSTNNTNSTNHTNPKNHSDSKNHTTSQDQSTLKTFTEFPTTITTSGSYAPSTYSEAPSTSSSASNSHS